MLNRQELQEISKLRRREAAALFKAKQYAGAYYLLGYSVECALKACISKQTKQYDFPDKDIASKVYTHNLETLLKLSGLERDFKDDMKKNGLFERNWTIVKDWEETCRYRVNRSRVEAKDLYSACTSRTNGILSWIKRKW